MTSEDDGLVPLRSDRMEDIDHSSELRRSRNELRRKRIFCIVLKKKWMLIKSTEIMESCQVASHPGSDPHTTDQFAMQVNFLLGHLAGHFLNPLWRERGNLILVPS
jgi:hypothetical protein